MYIQLSFYQISRAPAILFTTILNFWSARATPTRSAMNAVALVVAGFVIGCWGEPSFSWIGTAFALLSALSLAVYSVLVRDALRVVGGDQWRLLFYVSVASFLMLIPCAIAFGEHDTLSLSRISWYSHFWRMAVLSGACSFLVSLSITWMARFTPMVVNNLAGTSKAVLQTFGAILVYNNEFTIWVSGVCLCVCVVCHNSSDLLCLLFSIT
jgi:drug/metabolite transporter (DMT)-like permease